MRKSFKRILIGYIIGTILGLILWNGLLYIYMVYFR